MEMDLKTLLDKGLDFYFEDLENLSYEEVEQIEKDIEAIISIEALEKENKGLKEELEKANSERQEAIENTHMALLALQQEKQNIIIRTSKPIVFRNKIFTCRITGKD